MCAQPLQHLELAARAGARCAHRHGRLGCQYRRMVCMHAAEMQAQQGMQCSMRAPVLAHRKSCRPQAPPLCGRVQPGCIGLVGAALRRHCCPDTGACTLFVCTHGRACPSAHAGVPTPVPALPFPRPRGCVACLVWTSQILGSSVQVVGSSLKLFFIL